MIKSSRLTAITLNGIGSYANGHRLQFKPLTVLCGTNGSGKSTWIKTLRMLKASALKGLLPFQLDSQIFPNFVNFSCSHDDFGHIEQLHPDSFDEHFGPPATIGIEFEVQGRFWQSHRTARVEETFPGCNRNYDPDRVSGLPPSMRQILDYWSTGTLSETNSFQLQISLPHFINAPETSQVQFIQLAINGRKCLSLLGEYDDLEQFPKRALPMQLYLNSAHAFFKESGLANSIEPDKMVRLATFTNYQDESTWRLDSNFESLLGTGAILNPEPLEDPEKLAKTFRNLLCDFQRDLSILCKDIFSKSLFSIGPIREIESRHSLTTQDMLESQEPDHVGYKGQYAWPLFLRNAKRLCIRYQLPSIETETYVRNAFECIQQELSRLGRLTWASSRIIFPRSKSPNAGIYRNFGLRLEHNHLILDYLIDVSGEDLRQRFTELVSLFESRFGTYRDWLTKMSQRGEDSSEEGAKKKLCKVLVDELLERLSVQELKDFLVLLIEQATSSDRFSVAEMRKFICGPDSDDRTAQRTRHHKLQLFSLWRQITDRISDPRRKDSKRISNFLSLVCNAFLQEPTLGSYDIDEGPAIESTVGMKTFSEAISNYLQHSGFARIGKWGTQDTENRLPDARAAIIPIEFEKDFLLPETSSDFDPDAIPNNSLYRISHECFGIKGRSDDLLAPSYLSSGIHQVFPIFVQLSLTGKGDVTTIENPEVHLHADAIRKLAEFFIENANAGRVLLVETHSDLLIRRILRAIVSEEISQSQVSINAVELGGNKTVSTYKSFNWEIPSGGEQETNTFACSIMTPLALDGQGRITNWPKGFLDVDDDEVGLMLDALMKRRGGDNIEKDS